MYKYFILLATLFYFIFHFYLIIIEYFILLDILFYFIFHFHLIIIEDNYLVDDIIVNIDKNISINIFLFFKL